jgi:Ca-activated chloride channel family protein
MDIDLLNKIAEICGTEKARLARNTGELEEIMNLINQMEKSEIKIKNFSVYEELFPRWLLLAVTLLLLELVTRFFIIRQLP